MKLLIKKKNDTIYHLKSINLMLIKGTSKFIEVIFRS